MELREVMGCRRSIRFLRPYQSVEKWKIQYMFEAARVASHWGNVQSLRGVAVFREGGLGTPIYSTRVVRRPAATIMDVLNWRKLMGVLNWVVH